MAAIGKQSGVVKKVSTDLILGLGLGVGSDAAVEVLRVPILNDSGTFGNTTISNFEIVGYGLSIFAIVAGIIDIIIGKGVITFTRDHIFKFTGFMLGIYFYEHTLADLLGIRKFNPYEYANKLIPAVLPSDTALPLIPSVPN